MIGPSVWADCPSVTFPSEKIAPWKYELWLSVTPPCATNMNIDVPGVHALKSQLLPLYAAVSFVVFQPQKTPLFESETVPDTYMTIMPPSPSEPSEPDGCVPYLFIPRYLTSPLIVTFPSMKTVPRTLRMWLVASQSSSPITNPFAFFVWHV